MGLALGAMLIEEASAPLRHASHCLAARNVKEALAELAEPRLREALARGVAAVAKRVGVKPRVIESALLKGKIKSLLLRIAKTQPQALGVWSQHADRLGGFLTGIVDVTMEEGPPDVGSYLDSLAARVSRDLELSVPIGAIAVDITAWSDLLARCARRIDDVSAFARAYRAKRLRQSLLVLLAVSSVGVLVAYGFRVRASRARIGAALADADACADYAITPSDLKRATREQVDAVAERGRACDARRARADLEAHCDALAAHVEAGALAPEDPAGLLRPLLDRIAKRALDPPDLAVEPAFPCTGAPNERLWAAFVNAAAASTIAWQTADAISPKLAAALRAKGTPLSVGALRAIAYHAEIVSHRGLISGKSATLDQGKQLCEFEDALGLEQGPSCKRLLVVLASMKR